MNQEEIKNIAFELKDKWDEIARLWAFTNHYDDTGEIKQKAKTKTIVPLKGESLFKRLHTLRTYLTPSYIKKLKPEKIEKYKAELAQIEKQIEEDF